MRFAVALLLLEGVATFFSCLLGVVEGSWSLGVLLSGLTLGVVVALLGAWRLPRDSEDEKGGAFDVLALLAFGLVSAWHFWGVLFDRDGFFWTRDVHNYGDLPLHWTYIRYFAQGVGFWPQNPIFTGVRLQYPFGVDLFTAMPVRLGVSLSAALRAAGLVSAALMAYGLWKWGRGFAVACFLFSGGVLGREAAWKNLFLALVVTQRGFLFALPVGLLLLSSWRARFVRQRQSLPAWIEGVLFGVMPLFHLHTFLFLSVVFALWVILSREWRRAVEVLALAFLPATWSIVQVTDTFRSASLVWWKPGWLMTSAPEGPAAFLLMNFAFFLPLFAVAAWISFRNGDHEGLLTVLPGLGLFVALFFVMLAPWDWDNTKVMIWCYLLVLPAAFRLVLAPLSPAARGLALVLLLAPGAVTVVLSISPKAKWKVASVDEVDSVCGALKDLSAGDRVATAQSFSHPVALCGHPLVAGYAGHLWSHGIKAERVEADLKALMLGQPGWEDLAVRLEARYLFWGPREEDAFPRSARPWEGARRAVAATPWGTLYDLGPVPSF